MMLSVTVLGASSAVLSLLLGTAQAPAVRGLDARNIAIQSGEDDSAILELLSSSLQRVLDVSTNIAEGSLGLCAWDTFRTVHPLLSIVAPTQAARIVNEYIDAWRQTGFLPECENNSSSFVRGGADAMLSLSDFVVKYGDRSAELGVSTEDLYQALVDTATNTPADWNLYGRQNTAWTQFDYIPTGWNDPSGTIGLDTREISRTLEYAYGDFSVYQAAVALNKSEEDQTLFQTRAMGFTKVWDSTTTSDGFKGFVQRKFANGSFAFNPPNQCSPVGPPGLACGSEVTNEVGIYDSSSWEMSFYAPHSMSTLITQMGSNQTFITRLDHYFSAGYYTPTSRPSFSLPWAYHYANRPDLSALRIREVVFGNLTNANLVSSDATGAMSALSVFHILGLYPAPFSWQLLIGSPMVSSYVLNNDFLGTTTTVTVDGFDSASLAAAPANNSRVYVNSIMVNGKPTPSICWIAFDDLVGGGDIVIKVDADTVGAAARGCDGATQANVAKRGSPRGTTSLPDNLKKRESPHGTKTVPDSLRKRGNHRGTTSIPDSPQKRGNHRGTTSLPDSPHF